MSDQAENHDTSSNRVPIVALCASAGGLDAFQLFFDALPLESQMAFVVVQHLGEHQESILHELIQRHTPMVVKPITHDELVEINCVYVLPAGHGLQIRNRRLQLSPKLKRNGWPKTIDNFLSSLAEDQAEQAVSVILSGAGTDGLEGARAIRRAGGLVIAQRPDSAAHSAMPTNVIENGLADVIMQPSDIPETLLSYFEIDLSISRRPEQLVNLLTSDDVDRVIRRLQRMTSRDFADYKRSTLQRQIARRMSIHQVTTIEAYLDILTELPQEASQLVQYLLINVTSFFRDPESFEALKSNALLPSLKKLDIDTTFRVWIPGCASGDEAVSIAILIHECLRELDMPDMVVRIFATDTNRDLVRRARMMTYPASIAEEMSTSRLHDHFILENDTYRLRTHIRRMLIWSEHDLVEHPPFSKLDLISCRNVMIYFQKHLQDRILGLFAFALRPGGVLFLGSSEALPHNAEAFSAIDTKHKIYQRGTNKQTHWMRLDQPLYVKIPNYSNTQMRQQDPNAHENHELQIIKNMLIEHYRSTCVIVDEHYRVRYSYGEIDRYLRMIPGRDGQQNILDMARPGLDIDLTIALHEAYNTGGIVSRQGVWIKTDGEERFVNLIVKPINDTNLRGTLKLIIFELVIAEDVLRKSPADSPENEEVLSAQVSAQLEETHKALQNVTQAFQAKSEELATSIQELRSVNEESQTTNEELRTSKEELESMNEELNTLNIQLTNQHYELVRTNNNMHNFLQSTEIGMIFLDLDLQVREYTAAVTHIFGLRPNDIGRPLREIVDQLSIKKIAADTEAVLNTLVSIEREVITVDSHWYMMYIRPYRTTNNIIDGLVLTFNDITAQKQAQFAAEQQNEYVRQVFDTIADCLIELDETLHVKIVNRSFYETFQTTPDEVLGKHLYELGGGQWDIPELRLLITDIIPKRTAVQNFEVTYRLPDDGMRKMRLNARQIEDSNRILLVITDISTLEDE